MKRLVKCALVCIGIFGILTLGITILNIVDKRDEETTINSMEELRAHKVDVGELMEIIIINGKSENWKLKDFKICNFDEYQITGTGTIEFLGSKEELDKLTFFAPRITVKREDQDREQDLCGDSYSVNSLSGTSIFSKNENGQWLYNIPKMMCNFDKINIRVYDETVKIAVEIEYKNEEHHSIKDNIPIEVLVINKEIFEDIGRFGFSF